MASKKLLCILIVYFFALGSATYCNDDSDCSLSESCCSDKVCRQTYYNCSYDYQCGRNAAIANASVVRLLVTVRTTPIVALERIVVGESVIHHSVVGAVELLQVLLTAQLFSSRSCLLLFPVSIVHPVLWSSPANSHNNKWSQLTHTWRRNKYMLLRRWITIQLVTTCLLKALIRHLHLTQAIHRHQTNILHRWDKLKRRRCRLQ